MAAGDLTMTNHGTYDTSGAALKTKVDTLNLTGNGASGAGIYFIPMANGAQVQLIEVASG